MTSKSKFAGLAGALRGKQDKPRPESAPKKVGKSKDKNNYSSTTIYLLKPVHKDVQIRLAERELELSQVVEDLLVDWLKTDKL